MVKSSHCYWTRDGVEYEVHYGLDHGEIAGFSLYPKPDFKLTREEEQDIITLIYEDAQND